MYKLIQQNRDGQEIQLGEYANENEALKAYFSFDLADRDWINVVDQWGDYVA